MFLSSGTRLGPYEIAAPLGAGGVTAESAMKKADGPRRFAR